ncbi:cell division protein ZapE [Actinopolyspora lacussalsi subsp. righensis]|uniref:Cell division protein ZapE n=1 Tax=Actinopolyspora righensis TaxID=995060 RepID=A0A1I7AT91_9ACTN|nr:cell division protein ZapE [Actinopolyspora righensis]SFT78097.1 cell division protein ZapE [Actinopolyspora righensis]
MSMPRLVDRHPELGSDELVAALTPPPRFDEVRFDNYLPNPAEPSQAAAVAACREFAADTGRSASGGGSWLRSLFGRGGRNGHSGGLPGLYLDGGFGVGKTHLLASLWHEVEQPKAYATFVELTNLVGVLGFNEAVRRLSDHRLLAIDEFELDDPGDTMLVTQLLSRLTDAGVRVAATSNTLPDKLGEGRFAAVDFLREIHAMAERFRVVRVDGPDYRHRDQPEPPEPLEETELAERARTTPAATFDDFEQLCAHLQRVHPSKYGRMVDDVTAVHLSGLHTVPNQGVALRVVALADRLYDRAVPVRVSGEPLSVLFGEEMLAGGYRKKYLRALSRLTALSRELATS